MTFLVINACMPPHFFPVFHNAHQEVFSKILQSQDAVFCRRKQTLYCSEVVIK